MRGLQVAKLCDIAPGEASEGIPVPYGQVTRRHSGKMRAQFDCFHLRSPRREHGLTSIRDPRGLAELHVCGHQRLAKHRADRWCKGSKLHNHRVL